MSQEPTIIEEINDKVTKGARVRTAVRLGAEALLPGANLFAKGRIAEGGLHCVAAIAATMVMGPVGALFVRANSVSRAVSDKHLVEYFNEH
jgi:hypothetical protein